MKKNYVTSYSGYLTTNEEYNSNLFFWFFVSWERNAPLILWINERVGGTCMKAVFVKHGPFFFDSTGTFRVRAQEHWVTYYNMLYIDSPIGAGFSFTNHEDGYAHNSTQVVDTVFEALKQFLKLFPDLRSRALYLAGEVYASLFIPELALKIHSENLKFPRSKLNLQGISMDSPYLDPRVQLQWSDHLLNLGLVDPHEASRMKEGENKIQDLIRNENYSEAMKAVAEVSGEYPNSMFRNFTGLYDSRNVLQESEHPLIVSTIERLESDAVQTFLHVGAHNFTYYHLRVRQHYFARPENLFKAEIVQKLEQVLNSNYRVMISAGNMGALVGQPELARVVQSLRWNYSNLYAKAGRKIWRDSETDGIAGYYKVSKNLVYLVVRHAGNSIAMYNIQRATDAMRRFTK